MLIDPRQSSRFLMTADELTDESNTLCIADLAPMRTMLDWSRTYLFKSDKRQGRKGPVCPFIRPGLMNHNSLYFTRIRTPDLDLDLEATKQQLIGYRDWFFDLRPKGLVKRNFKAILALLPDLSGHPSQTEFIETIHRDLKPAWVERGLMLGQFYPECDAEGLHNPDFRPLRTPEPLFVMRHMQLTDLPFLVKTEQYIRSYCRTFEVTTQTELEMRISEAQIPKLPRDWGLCMSRVFGGAEASNLGPT